MPQIEDIQEGHLNGTINPKDITSGKGHIARVEEYIGLLAIQRVAKNRIYNFSANSSNFSFHPSIKALPDLRSFPTLKSTLATLIIFFFDSSFSIL